MRCSLKIWVTLFLPALGFSQGVSWNIGYLSQIGRGQQAGIDYNYLENYVSTSLEVGNWYLDLSYEYSAPPEYGFNRQGLERIFISYIGDVRTLELGDISAVFGRGLALNLDDNQALDFDNEIMGIRLTSAILGLHEIDIVAGANHNYHFYSPSSKLREPDGEASYELAGLEATLNSPNGAWSLAPFLIASRLRSDYAWRQIDPDRGSITSDTVTQAVHAIQSGWGQSIYGNSWDLYFEYSRTLKALDYPLVTQSIQTIDGGFILENTSRIYETDVQAINFQVNWFPDWFTSMFEYKRYLNGRESASDKRDPLRLASKPLPWQMGPTGIREHDISLLGSVTHPVDFGDELGWNLELRKSLSNRWDMVLNATQTSQSAEVGNGYSFWPEQDISLNPWQEYFAEFEYSGAALYQRMLIAYTRSVLSGESTAEIMEHVTLVPAYLSWHPNPDLVFSHVLELQSSRVYGERYTGERLEGHDFISSHVILSADYQHNYSTSLIWDASNDPSLNNGTDATQHWVSGEISVKPREGLWVRASYGKEKGGVRCTGGVCRVLNPFEGFRMTLEWRL